MSRATATPERAFSTGRKSRDPDQPNLRQVHRSRAELYEELVAGGFEVAAGQLGENITTAGLDLLGLARGTRLASRPAGGPEVTGLRNPRVQIDGFGAGCWPRSCAREAAGRVVRRAGVMSVVLVGGDIACGDEIR